MGKRMKEKQARRAAKKLPIVGNRVKRKRVHKKVRNMQYGNQVVVLHRKIFELEQKLAKASKS